MTIDHEAVQTFSSEPASTMVPAAPTRPPWTKIPSTRLTLGCLILVAVGFTAGVLEAKHTGTTAATATRTGAAATVRTGTTAGFAGAAGGGSGNTATVGTVKLVSGDTIYLTTTDGSVVKVTTSGATNLKVSATGKATDLKAGATIVVQGTKNAAGAIAATAVTESSSAGTGQAGAGPAARSSGQPGG